MVSGRREDNFDTWQILNIHVKICIFYVIDEMSGCLKPKLGQKLVASGACLIEVHLRNEFHFSGVHGIMNRSGSRAK